MDSLKTAAQRAVTLNTNHAGYGVFVGGLDFPAKYVLSQLHLSIAKTATLTEISTATHVAYNPVLTGEVTAVIDGFDTDIKLYTRILVDQKLLESDGNGGYKPTEAAKCYFPPAPPPVAPVQAKTGSSFSSGAPTTPTKLHRSMSVGTGAGGGGTPGARGKPGVGVKQQII